MIFLFCLSDLKLFDLNQTNLKGGNTKCYCYAYVWLNLIHSIYMYVWLCTERVFWLYLAIKLEQTGLFVKDVSFFISLQLISIPAHLDNLA